VSYTGSRLDIPSGDLLVKKAMNIRKTVRTIPPLMAALITASASAFAYPVLETPKPANHGFSVFAEAKKSKISVDANGVAIQGYDPVAFIKQKKPVKGSPANQSVYQGAKFYFASAADKKEFDKSPTNYLPQYGGYCANALRKGKLVPGDPNVFYFHKGKLYFCSSKQAGEEFQKNIDKNLIQSDDNWRQLFGS
jgi:YHS domain-containing protein